MAGTISMNRVFRIVWALMLSSLVVQVVAVALYIDSDPFRMAPARTVSVAPTGGQVSKKFQGGDVSVRVNIAKLTRLHAVLASVSLLLTAAIAVALLCCSTELKQRNRERVVAAAANTSMEKSHGGDN